MPPWKVIFTIFRHAALIIFSLPCCLFHIHGSLTLGVELSSFLISEIICIDNVDL